MEINTQWHLRQKQIPNDNMECVYDQELLGIICALKEWQHHIQGSGHMAMVHMDYKKLTYFRKAQKLSD